jgi:ATPase subunit of ABC transporter with duplicated ATPase domains
MLDWLEDYLSGYKGAILAVSHDRYFLDKTVKTVFEMENKTVVRYSAGYTGYLDLRDARIARQQKEYDRQMREIASLEDFIAKNKARASTTNRAQSREKELDRMERLERPVPPEKPPKFSFPFERDPVKDVLIVEGLELSSTPETRRKSSAGDRPHHPPGRKSRDRRAQRRGEEYAAQDAAGHSAKQKGHRRVGQECQNRLLRPE